MAEETTNNGVSPLSMSDADFLAAPLPAFEQASSVEDQQNKPTEVEQEQEENNEVIPDTDANQGKQAPDDIIPTNKPSEEKPTEEKQTEVTTHSAEEQLAKLFTPFKANGRDIKIDSVDDAITLMQQGANYNKKMAALKPSLKILKMLENNQLLDEGKLSYLIDIDKKNPEAIAKLIKDSGIDPLDVNVEEPKYTPKDYSVSEQQVNLDSVLDSIESTPTYQKTMTVILDEWDSDSKRALANEPNLIPLINAHMANGIYDQIADEMAKQKALGTLNGLSDLQAYEQVGKQLAASGAFNAKPKPVEVKAKTHMQTETERDKQRKAASPAKQTPPVKQQDEGLNPLAMSDEEFEKAFNSKFR